MEGQLIMDILNAKNYGDILSTEEYLIDKENNNIISNFTYIGNNKVSNFIDEIGRASCRERV